MKVLLTGANGFVAPYLSRELSRGGHQVFLTAREEKSQHSGPYFVADLTDPKQVSAVVDWAKPDAVVHLAGISNIASQDAHRADLITAINIDATAHICRSLQSQLYSSVLLIVSTGLVYREVNTKNFSGFNESSALGPVNDYGWSKLAAEAIATIYNSGKVKTYIVRPFNHIGPGQDFRFVTPSLAKRIIEADDGATIPVGDLTAQRDFTDVRDIVRAYRLILEMQPEQRTFVLGSGLARPISDIFNFFVEYSQKRILTSCSTELLRTEQSSIFGDPSLAHQILSWSPEIPFQQTLKEIYDHLLSQSRNP